MLVFMNLYLIMNKFYTLKQDALLAMDFLEKGTGLNTSVKPHVILKSCDQNDESCGFDRISRPNGNGIKYQTSEMVSSPIYGLSDSEHPRNNSTFPNTQYVQAKS